MNHTEFVVNRFKNRNGVTSWRVAGRLHGVRIRKNFPTREEAAAEKGTLEIKAAQANTGLSTVATSLTPEQLREAEAAFQRLAGNPRRLSFYLDFALSNYREPEKQMSLVGGISGYVAAKEDEFKQTYITRSQFGRIKSELKRLQRAFPGKTVAEITATSLVAFLEKAGGKLKTYNNRRGVLGTFFKFAFLRGWVVENPMLKVPHHRLRRKRGVALTLTAGRAAELMEFLETFEGGRWVPYFALCLFAGIRPGVPDGEIHKLRPEAVNLEDGLIHISAEVSKVREPRKVTIAPNLAAWLKAYPLAKFPLVVGNFQQRVRELRRKFNLTHDVLRHTFISMFVAKYRSIGEAAIQAGNSESIIRKHYLDTKSQAEAEKFYGILPKHAPASQGNEVVPMAPHTDLAVAMRLAQCVTDMAFLRGMSLRQAYDRLGIATEPKTPAKSHLVHKLPAHLILANRLLRALKHEAGKAGEEQGEAYRRDLRPLFDQLRPWFDGPVSAKSVNFGPAERSYRI